MLLESERLRQGQTMVNPDESYEEGLLFGSPPGVESDSHPIAQQIV